MTLHDHCRFGHFLRGALNKHENDRSKRESRLRVKLASVMDLPPSAMDDPNPFVPPSQYEVRQCFSLSCSQNLLAAVAETRALR